jgi:hypothetical protein
VIGVILHHLWLSVFYFMSMATLCIVMNLTKLRYNGQNGHSTIKDKKCCLALGGVLVPCMFVGPAVFLDIFGAASQIHFCMCKRCRHRYIPNIMA